MADLQTSKSQIGTELAQARTARAAGNEGMARVCARRAAGLAAGVYLEKKGHPVPGPSAIDRLNFLAGLPDIPEDWRQLCQNLVTRVNQDFQLPLEADLVEDAQTLSNALLAKIV